MSSTPKISIIMPTYNRAALIGESIQSIRNQTYKNWELIILDDGSQDNTEVIVSNFNDQKIKYQKLQHTGIGGKTKNTGLQISSGELVAFLDSDDLWADTKLEKQLTAFDQNPDAGYCLTGGYNFQEQRVPVDFFYKQKQGRKYGDLFYDCFTSGLTAFTQALLFKKSCLTKCGVFKEDKSFSDVEFIYSLAYNFKGIILYEPLVYRRLHKDNFIIANWEKSMEEGIKIIQNFRSKLPKKIWQKSIARSHLNFAEKYIKIRQHSKALRHEIKAWQYQPFSFNAPKKIVKTILHYFK